MDPATYDRDTQSGDTITGINFGNVAPATVEGVVFTDTDADGIRDKNEAAVQNVTVFADLDEDGERDENEPSALTSSKGAYKLTVLPGARDIRIVPPAGQLATIPVNGVHAATTLTPKQSLKNLNFGIRATGQQVQQQARAASQWSLPTARASVSQAVSAWSSGSALLKVTDDGADEHRYLGWTGDRT